YLTSGHQRGHLDDIFTQSAAVLYHIAPQAFPTLPVSDTTPYFTKALFNQVRLAEPNLAGENGIWLLKKIKRIFIFSGVG
ncbi:type VI secretion protein IcmF/TssM N-terminal domain-containing protein, partial [Yersinia pestis]|uniref:type VI secretion protein IcmF/TssM N-terminal domain-containing protein n=1 Tax=Yersinia pestis TaxID=632 RepID=UPI001C4882BB